MQLHSSNSNFKYQPWPLGWNKLVVQLAIGRSKLKSNTMVSVGFSVEFRATSHMRPRARDHYTSSTLIGGKGGAGPSLLHTMLERPT